MQITPGLFVLRVQKTYFLKHPILRPKNIIPPTQATPFMIQWGGLNLKVVSWGDVYQAKRHYLVEYF